MARLVFCYSYDNGVDSWHHTIPFEYISKDDFIFDVLESPMILNSIGIDVFQSQVDDKSIYEESFIENIEHNVQYLNDWFEQNKRIL